MLCTIYGCPIVALALMYVWLRIIWPEQKPNDAKSSATKGLLDAGSQQIGTNSCPSIVPYTHNWTDTFDVTFLIGMIVFAVALTGFTQCFYPELLTNPDVWINFLFKFVVMILSSMLGGGLTRYCAETDPRGYIKCEVVTQPNGEQKVKTCAKIKNFKVNYTRKIQHFAAYAVPVFMPSPIPMGPLELAWGDFWTLMGFVILIKPIRELHWFFMMQFNSMDRPEDRPYTLKWIVLGDIVPGMVAIIGLFWLLNQYTCPGGASATGFCFIFLMVTGLGDGFAEPVGVHWGKHKYQVGAFMSGSDRKYTRSFEGSCTVALSTYIFVAMRWYLFPNATSFWLTMLMLPPLMTLAEAKSPHTMDTPFLFVVGGLWCWVALFVPPLFG